MNAKEIQVLNDYINHEIMRLTQLELEETDKGEDTMLEFGKIQALKNFKYFINHELEHYIKLNKEEGSH